MEQMEQINKWNKWNNENNKWNIRTWVNGNGDAYLALLGKSV